MSRIGKKPIALPKGVTVKVNPDALDIQGPKGKLTQRIPPGIALRSDRRPAQGGARCARTRRSASFTAWPAALRPTACSASPKASSASSTSSASATARSLRGKQVVFALGYSHSVVFDVPTGIDIAIEKQTHVTVTGVDRQLVGQVAANIRRLRKPDPYKQKGVRYTGEVLKKKAGKTGTK